MNELRSVQPSFGQLRTQVEGIASKVDTSQIVASQEALSRRISRIEDGMWHDRNTLTKEQGRAAETQREYQTKADLFLARIERLTNRMRTQDWYRELSDKESEDDNAVDGNTLTQHLHSF